MATHVLHHHHRVPDVGAFLRSVANFAMLASRVVFYMMLLVLPRD